MEFRIEPIGFVKKPEDGRIFLNIDSRFWDATLNIDKFSHIHVIWWATGFDMPEYRTHLQDVPPTEGAENSGVFASRSPARPNVLCLSIVKIVALNEENRVIEIDQIDAKDETPIVDIKPYLPSSDRVDDAVVPEWFKDLKKRYTK
ncbi:MAG: TrmO family methyltransferase [Candidatus Thorarchaeota archaeon]